MLSYNKGMDASYTQHPSIQEGDASADTQDTRWSKLVNIYPTMDHSLQWMKLLQAAVKFTLKVPVGIHGLDKPALDRVAHRSEDIVHACLRGVSPM